MNESPHCVDCGTKLCQEAWAPGLCPACSLALALEHSHFDAAIADDPEALPTLQYPGGAFAEGQILGSRFQIRSLLGRGGMGEVWRAFDLKLRVDVALKALRSELLQDERALGLLRREVRTAREVISPNVCRVFDLVELDGRELVSMEYIDGITLLEILRARGPLELEEAREIASQFLAGLEAIHQAGLVHRDMKPENVMITRAGRVVVMDFGIAKGLASERTGTVSGTPAYMAPEQSRGEVVDARADVFSAGVVMAEMVAPGGVKDLEARQAVWRAAHESPPVVGDGPWSRVLAKALDAYPERRYTTAASLARALEVVTLRSKGAEDLHPYPGLAAFTEEQAEFFFGRELEVEAMWRKLRRPHLLALIGPSGAGKSSFLRAGLLPATPEGWRAVVTNPGARPFMNLGRVLMRELSDDTEVLELFLRFEEPEVAVSLFRKWQEQHERALVIVDQFEELFTLNPPELQVRFADLLARLALDAGVHVLLSMRDDFLFHCQALDSLQPIFSELTPLGILGGSGLRRALVQPALKCGYRFEDEALVERMVEEVSEEKGALPMLAFAASKLWDHRDRERGLLTREAYEHIGGVGGALAQHAEATLERLGQDSIPSVREIFRNLITSQGTRAERSREELLSVFESDPGARSSGDSAARVLDALIDARLLTSYEVPAGEGEDQPHQRIEIIHESLLSNWPRLVRWQTQDREGAQLRDELRQAAQLWEQHGRSSDRLWTGTAFQEYQLWRQRYQGGLTNSEEAFASAMGSLATRRRRRRRLIVAAVLVVTLGVAAVTTGLWRRSELERRRAEAQKLLALGQIDRREYPTAALAYARASLELVDTPEARVAALDALWHGGAERIVQPINAGMDWLAVSPDGKWLTAPAQASVPVVASTGEVYFLPDLPSCVYTGQMAAFDATSEHLVTWCREGGEIHVWSLADRRWLRRLAISEVGEMQHWSGRVIHDSLVTRSTTEGLRRAWPLAGGPPRVLPDQPTPDSECFADLARDRDLCVQGNNVLVRSLDGGSPEQIIIGSHEQPAGFAIAPMKGDRIVSATTDWQDPRVWTLTDGTPTLERVLVGADGVRYWPVFDPEGRWLAWGVPMMHTVYLWDLEGPPGASPEVYLTRETEVIPLPSPDPVGRWLAASYGGGISVWLRSGREPFRLVPPRKVQWDALEFAADSLHLVTSLRVWPLNPDARPGREMSAVFYGLHPDGETLAFADRERVWIEDPSSGVQVIVEERSESFPAMDLAWSMDGRLLAFGTYRDQEYWPERPLLQIFDVESGHLRDLPLADDPEITRRWGITNVEFAPGERLFTSGWGGVRVWDLARDAFETVYEDGYACMSPSRDGRLLLVGGQGNAGNWNTTPIENVVLFDLEHGVSRQLAAHTHMTRSIALGPSGEIVASGTEDGVVRVGRVGEEPHLLMGHEGAVFTLVISPDKRWIASEADDGIRVWPIPDLAEPPFHTLPHDELLARLDTLTNLRAVEDGASTTGWTLEVGPFPGWEEVPEW